MNKKKSSGFTLVEVCLAISLGLIIIGASGLIIRAIEHQNYTSRVLVQAEAVRTEHKRVGKRWADFVIFKYQDLEYEVEIDKNSGWQPGMKQWSYLYIDNSGSYSKKWIGKAL